MNPSNLPKLFGMDHYYQKILSLLSQNKNIMIMGLAGVGKTVLVKNICHQLKNNNNKLFRYYYVSDLMFSQQKLQQLILQIDSDQSQLVGNQKQKPCIVIDEIDVLWAQNRTQTLNLLENILNSADYKVIVITSRPWFLKNTFVYGYHKVYIQLPSYQARVSIIKEQLLSIPNQLVTQDIEKIADSTHGFSCSDLLIFMKDVAFQPLREFMKSNSVPLAQINHETIIFPKIKYDIFNDKLKKVKPSFNQQDQNRLLEYLN